MSTEVQDEVLVVDAALEDGVGDESGDFLAAPPPVPEGQKYLATMGLGRQGISRIVYDKKLDGVPTGEKAAFYKADVLLKLTGSEDGETDIAFFQGYLPYQPGGEDIMSFIPRGKALSGIGHIAQLCEVKVSDFPSSDFDSENDRVKAYYTAIERRLKSDSPIKVVVERVQWQWSMKGDFKTKAGKSFKYKTVAFGQASANKREDGTADPVLYFAADGTKVTAGTDGAIPVTAKAVALKIALQ
jgi:hypothetical protein